MKFLLFLLILGGLVYGGWRYLQLNPDILSRITTKEVQIEETPATPAVEQPKVPVPVETAPIQMSTEVDNMDVQIAFTAIGGNKIYSGIFPTINSDLVVNTDGSIAGMMLVNTASVIADDKVLGAYLLSPQGLNVKTFPTATIVITDWKPTRGTVDTYNVTGRLSLRGVTRTINTTAVYSKLTKQYSVSVEINPKEFGTSTTVITQPVQLMVVLPMK